MQPERRNKIVLFTGVATFVVFIAFLWFLIAGLANKVAVEVFVVPSDASITVDGKPVNLSKGKISIRKGKHTFEATRHYFKNVQQQVDTQNLPTNKTIYLALHPNSPEGEKYLQEHPQEQARYERIAGAAFSAVNEKLLKNYPITRQLPYETLDFKIDYDVSRDKKAVVFLVKLYEPAAVTPGTDLYKKELTVHKSQALGYLKDNGVDTNKVKITFTPDPDKL